MQRLTFRSTQNEIAALNNLNDLRNDIAKAPKGSRLLGRRTDGGIELYVSSKRPSIAKRLSGAYNKEKNLGREAFIELVTRQLIPALTSRLSNKDATSAVCHILSDIRKTPTAAIHCSTAQTTMLNIINKHEPLLRPRGERPTMDNVFDVGKKLIEEYAKRPGEGSRIKITDSEFQNLMVKELLENFPDKTSLFNLSSAEVKDGFAALRTWHGVADKAADPDHALSEASCKKVLDALYLKASSAQPGEQSQLVIDGETITLPSLTIGEKIYKPVSLLGASSFGKVFKYINPNDPDDAIAVKRMASSQDQTRETNEEMLQKASDEALRHRALTAGPQGGRPNLVGFIGAYRTSTEVFHAMELANGGTVYEKLDDLKKQPIQEKIKLLAQVAQGLCELADAKIIHNDLKWGNVFLNNGEAKIGDFGESFKFGEKASNEAAPDNVYHQAPEMLKERRERVRDNVAGDEATTSRKWNLKDNKRLAKADVWSFGIMAAELFGAKPKEESQFSYDYLKGMDRFANEKFHVAVGQRGRIFNSTGNRDFDAFLNDILKRDSRARPKPQELLIILDGLAQKCRLREAD